MNRRLKKTVILSILIVGIFSTQLENVFAATSTKFMVLPFTRGAVIVQQGWVSHFYPNPYTNNIHGGIDYIRPGTQSGSAYWLNFDVAAVYAGKLTCFNGAKTGRAYEGIYCEIKHSYNGQTYYSRYVHLKSAILSIPAAGTSKTVAVTQGQVIGVAGDTGSAKGTGIHLHFELRLGTSKGTAVDPYGLYAKQDQGTHTTYPSATSKNIVTPKSGKVYYWVDNPPRIYAQSTAYVPIINTPTNTPSPTWTATHTSTSTITFTPTPSLPTETPTTTATYTPTETFVPTNTFTPTAMPSFTNTPSLPKEPIVVEPSLNPAYPDGCSSSNRWLTIPNGYLTLNTNSSTPDHTARWYPDFSVAGRYKVEVFIPNHSVIIWPCNNVQITEDTSSAKYQIYYQGATSTVSTILTVDQLPISDGWITLGTYSFEAYQKFNQYVKLTNITQETNQTHTVSVSYMRFTYVGP